jgi:DNA-binding protein YbaB
MTSEIDPLMSDVQQQLVRFTSALEDEKHRTNTQTFRATDEAKTVEVVINGNRWLTGLYIEPGLLRLGVDVVQQRILEALTEAQSAAFADRKAAASQLEEAMAAMLGNLEFAIGDLPTQ